MYFKLYKNILYFNWHLYLPSIVYCSELPHNCHHFDR